MSLEMILAGIEAAAAGTIQQLNSETAATIAAIQQEAEQEAAARHEAARHAAFHPTLAERAQSLHQAHLRAAEIISAARAEMAARVLDEVQTCLSHLRAVPDYPLLLRNLTAEALYALGEEEVTSGRNNSHPPILLCDPRDERLLVPILRELNLALALEPALESWGGIILKSGDGRITITNTLESRLQQALAHR